MFFFSERLFRAHADMMVVGGYLSAGYQFLILDDCWLNHTRDSKDNSLIPDPARSSAQLIPSYPNLPK